MKLRYLVLAALVYDEDQLTPNQRVDGSTPSVVTNDFNDLTATNTR